MSTTNPHSKIAAQAKKEFHAIFSESKQGMYIYLDDANAFCNQTFAKWLGYKNPAEWEKAGGSFPMTHVLPASRHALVSSYRNAMEKAEANVFEVGWKSKSGKPVKTDVILAPIEIGGHRMAIHFIEKR